MIGPLRRALFLWDMGRSNAHIKDETVGKRWLDVVHACRSLANNELPQYCRHCGADQEEFTVYGEE